MSGVVTMASVTLSESENAERNFTLDEVLQFTLLNSSIPVFQYFIQVE